MTLIEDERKDYETRAYCLGKQIGNEFVERHEKIGILMRFYDGLFDGIERSDSTKVLLKKLKAKDGKKSMATPSSQKASTAGDALEQS
jgi:hypothetical protein